MAGAAAVAAMVMAGCGGSSAAGGPRQATVQSGPFAQGMPVVQRRLVAAGLGVHRAPLAHPLRGVIPQPLNRATFRTGDGTPFEVLVYGDPQTALRARASARQRERGRVVLRNNLLLVLPGSPTREGDAVVRVVRGIGSST